MFRSDVAYAAARQVAADYGCTVSDLEEDRVTVRELPASSERLRGISSDLRAVTFGRGTVINTRIELIPFAKKLAQSDGLSLFDGAGIAAINSGLKPFGGMISSIKVYYLPDELTESRIGDIKLRVFEKDEIPSLYSLRADFPDALTFGTDGCRHETLAVCAYDNNDIIGIACAADDSRLFRQIGIDVLPRYRSRGVAGAVVTMLSKEVIRRGAIPYYGTWPGNIASHNLALHCGYRPAWTEMI